MSVASPVDKRVNPNDRSQRMVLWGNGRLESFGGAPQATGFPTWYDSLAPMPIAVALHVTDWATPAGYVLDLFGAMHSFGGAPNLNTTGEGWAGLPYRPNQRTYVDWAWRPDGSGDAYVLDLWGELHPLNGSAYPARVGARWTQPFAKKLRMDWNNATGVRAITLDAYGGLHPDFDAVVGPQSAYWPNEDLARDFVVSDWATGSGHVLDLHGAVHEFGNASDTYGWPFRAGADVARLLEIISTTNPQKFWQVWSGGQQFEYVSSSPPGVVAGGSGNTLSPAANTTTTTRPVLAWSYGDLQGDQQALWQLLVFTQEFGQTHDMTDPFKWQADAITIMSGSNPTTRGVTIDRDLPNGNYVFYIAVQDTAGQWSAWSGYPWVQNVPRPTAPTGVTAVPDAGSFSVRLSASVGGGLGPANLVHYQFSDDGGSSWWTVRGAGAIPLTSTSDAVDYDVPLGRVRSYRATVYSTSPQIASAPSASTTARLDEYTYVLTSTADPSIGGEVHAIDPSEWTRTAEAGVFQGLGSEFPTVVSDGAPKSRRLTLHVQPQNREQWQQIEALAESDSTLVYRDAFGEVVYCRLVGDWSRRQLPAAPLAGEVTPLRHLHVTPLPLVEVAPPVS